RAQCAPSASSSAIARGRSDSHARRSPLSRRRRRAAAARRRCLFPSRRPAGSRGYSTSCSSCAPWWRTTTRRSRCGARSSARCRTSSARYCRASTALEPIAEIAPRPSPSRRKRRSSSSRRSKRRSNRSAGRPPSSRRREQTTLLPSSPLSGATSAAHAHRAARPADWRRLRDAPPPCAWADRCSRTSLGKAQAPFSPRGVSIAFFACAFATASGATGNSLLCGADVSVRYIAQ
ncbi:hypothetical protein EMIHUDRAFT_436467, partial [Emiliania huxleyi CCMP1516]|uniref:Uncharacterized protein n=2 Tax=Emiliania huxleyi TaxID=2903 RepID=A0A0D3IZU4_EMIH1